MEQESNFFFQKLFSCSHKLVFIHLIYFHIFLGCCVKVVAFHTMVWCQDVLLRVGHVVPAVFGAAV